MLLAALANLEQGLRAIAEQAERIREQPTITLQIRLEGADQADQLRRQQSRRLVSELRRQVRG